MRPYSALILLLSSIVLSACSSLQPVDRAMEFTDLSEDNPLWSHIRELQPGQWQVILNNGPEALDWRLKAIDSATDSIDVQTFLWTMDTTGSLVLDHLVRAAERGVLVKILIDDTFLAGEDALLLTLANHDNIEYRVFNPFKRRSSNLLTREILNLSEFHRLDHRMHNKSMIVDRRIAIVGGRNLADEYFGLDENANFRDMELLVGGPIVDDISGSFDDYWNNEWAFPIQEIAHINTTQLVPDTLGIVIDQNRHIHTEQTRADLMEQWADMVKDAYRGNVSLISDTPPAGNPAAQENAPVQLARSLQMLFEEARENVILISAYLIPGTDLEEAMRTSAEKGVSIQLLTNSIRSNNHLAAHSAYRNHITTLLNNGARLHEVRADARDRAIYMTPPVESKALALHAKVLIIDHDKVFIGSPNFDPRSLRMNTEMGLLVESEALNRAVRNAYAIDFLLENAWELALDDGGQVLWRSDEETRTSLPASSFMQRIEDWFMAHLPIEGEL